MFEVYKFKVSAVIGANFGDEGKGLVTDWLASKSDNAIVVLHNGGPQRAHTVTTPEGREHIFRHIGAGTFVGAATYIAKSFICNPMIFKEEYEKLMPKLFNRPKIYIDKRCKFTTFYDMIINQAREIERGVAKHGSCGLGIYETICRYRDKEFVFQQEVISPYGISIGEFATLSYLGKYDYLKSLKKYYTEKRIDQTKIHKMPIELEKALESEIAIQNYISDFEFMMKSALWQIVQTFYAHMMMSFLRMVRACCQIRIIWNIIRILHLAILVYITSMKFSKNVILPAILMLTTFQEHI